MWKMLAFYYVVGASLAFLVFLYFCLDIHYFLRLTVTMLLAKYCKKKVNVLDEVCVKGEFLKTGDSNTLTNY